MVIALFKPTIPENYNAFYIAAESNKQSHLDRNLYLPFVFRYKHIVCLKNHFSLAQGQSLPYWFLGSFCGRVCFDLPDERISFVCSH